MASVSYRGRPTNVRTVAGRWKQGNYKETQTKNGANSRNNGAIRYILIPSASASFRGRLAAAVSLVSDIHLIDGVGKLGAGRILENRKQKGAQNT